MRTFIVYNTIDSQAVSSHNGKRLRGYPTVQPLKPHNYCTGPHELNEENELPSVHKIICI